jgi:hypothetical protein
LYLTLSFVGKLWLKLIHQIGSRFDAPNCAACKKAMASKGTGSATPAEVADGASRVEL